MMAFETTQPMPAAASVPPPVPADCDVSKLNGFMLDTARLLGSEMLALASGDAFKAAVTLWCRAWRQVPAASLPDDDRVLCSFAGFGSDMKGWRKVRAMALRGFVKCDDGRLYHPVLAAEAIHAFERQKAFHRKRETDAERLRKWRETRFETPAETERTKPKKNVSSQKDKDRDRDINPQTPLPETSDDTVVWRNRLRHGPSGPWLSSWGSKPGEPDCEAPAALVAASPWRLALQGSAVA